MSSRLSRAQVVAKFRNRIERDHTQGRDVQQELVVLAVLDGADPTETVEILSGDERAELDALDRSAAEARAHADAAEADAKLAREVRATMTNEEAQAAVDSGEAVPGPEVSAPSNGGLKEAMADEAEAKPEWDAEDE